MENSPPFVVADRTDVFGEQSEVRARDHRFFHRPARRVRLADKGAFPAVCRESRRDNNGVGRVQSDADDIELLSAQAARKCLLSLRPCRW